MDELHAVTKATKRVVKEEKRLLYILWMTKEGLQGAAAAAVRGREALLRRHFKGQENLWRSFSGAADSKTRGSWTSESSSDSPLNTHTHTHSLNAAAAITAACVCSCYVYMHPDPWSWCFQVLVLSPWAWSRSWLEVGIDKIFSISMPVGLSIQFLINSLNDSQVVFFFFSNQKQPFFPPKCLHTTT